MKKTSLMSLLALALMASGTSWAASPLEDSSWTLKGKFSGSTSVRCKIGGFRGVPIKPRNNLSATLSLNADGTFVWSNDTLGPAVSASGQWTQNGNKLDFDFDDPSSVSYIQLFGSRYVGLPGGGAQFSPAKYDFYGETNAAGTKLKIVEKGGFTVNASASMGGGANACKFKVSISRNYKGKRN